MEKEYVKELDHTYLVLGDGQIDEDEYSCQMVLRGRLPGVLPQSIAMKDGKKSLRADVTACTNISTRFKNIALTGQDLRKILSAVRDTASKMPKLLMNAQDLYLDPECIFLGAGADQVLLCYVPHLSESQPHSVRMLAEFLIKKIDHSDPSAAALAYGLFDQVCEDSYILKDVLYTLLKEHTDAIASGADQSPDGSSWGRHSHADSPQNFSPYIKKPQNTDQPQIFSAHSSEYEEFSTENPKKVSPSSGRRRQTSSAGHSSSEHRRKRPKAKARRRRRKSLLKSLLPAAIILICALALILYFRMDLTQIAGMGFLCSALIWMIHNSMEKHRNERRNIWFDEDEESESDDRFYQSLRQELYAHDLGEDSAGNSGSGGYPFDDASSKASNYRFDGTATGNPGADRYRYGDAAAGSSGTDRYRYGGTSAGSPGADRYRYSDAAAGSSGTAGYRFGDDLTEGKTRTLQRDDPSLISLQKDRCPDITLNRPHLILGKSKTKADIILPDNTVSRKHARIERRMDGYYVTDLFSTNGTFLDGHRLESGQAVRLNDGVELTVSSLHYRVRIPQIQTEDQIRPAC